MKKRCEDVALWIVGKISTAIIFIPIWLWYMSKQRQNRRSTKRKKKEQTDMETPTMENTWPGKAYKVLKKPALWEGNCRFVGQIGKCQGTNSKLGAYLAFPEGEKLHFPLNCLEFVPDKNIVAETEAPKTLVPQTHKSYKVIKKPKQWKSHCRYLDQIGVCVTIDERGVRLRFPNGKDVSFQVDELEESEPMDINALASAVELNEDSIVVGNFYRVTRKPDKFGKDAEKLVGAVGKAKWANYRGICLQFPDKSGYVFDFDGVEIYIPPTVPNPVNTPMTLNANTIVIDREYKVINVDSGWNDYEKRNILNKMGKVKFASDVQKGAMMKFAMGIEKFIPFNYIQDLPRPTEEELIALIVKQPGRILRIIKGLNKITRLKPVMNFVEKGELPVVSTEASEPIGPNVPACFSQALLPQSVGEASDEMMNRVTALFKAEEAAEDRTAEDRFADDGYAG